MTKANVNVTDPEYRQLVRLLETGGGRLFRAWRQSRPMLLGGLVVILALLALLIAVMRARRSTDHIACGRPVHSCGGSALLGRAVVALMVPKVREHAGRIGVGLLSLIAWIPAQLHLWLIDPRFPEARLARAAARIEGRLELESRQAHLPRPTQDAARRSRAGIKVRAAGPEACGHDASTSPRPRSPALREFGPVQGEPLQRDRRRRRMDAPAAQPLERGIEIDDVHPDVLALIDEAVDPAGALGIDPADEHLAGLGAAAGAGEVGAGRDQVQELEAGLLGSLAPGHLGRALAAFDDAGHRLEQPGVVDHAERADPELLDQHHLIARGIERQHGGRMATLEHFTRQLPAHAAREQPVTQAVADDLEVAVVRDRRSSTTTRGSVTWLAGAAFR